MQAFEYLVAYLPEEDEDGNTPLEPAIIEHDTTLAKTEQGLVMRLTKKIPDKYDEHLEDIKIVVRPF